MIEPEGDTKMKVRRSEFGIETDRLVEVPDRFRTSIQYCEQKPGFIVQAGRFRIDSQGFLECRERTGGVALRLQSLGFGLDFLQAVRSER